MPFRNRILAQSLIRSGHPQKLAFLFLLCGYLFFQATAQAAPYQAATVRSLYLDNASGQWTRSTEWLFQGDGEGNITVREQKGSQPLVLIGYEAKGVVTMITKRLQRGNGFVEIKESVEGPIILSAGFPVPYDQLSPGLGNSAELKVKNSVGGMTFSAPVSREVSTLAPDEAVAQGMLSPEAAANIGGRGLSLITVMKTGRMEIRQLWLAGEPFWLYEETPIRKSWRTSLTALPQ